MSAHAVSAPGKVLLAGGYLVLDRKYTGLAFGLDARIHIHAQPGEKQQDHVLVRSPQFKDAVWSLRLDDHLRLTETQGRSNPFVETAVSYALAYAAGLSSRSQLQLPVVLTILADDGYYSDARTKRNPTDSFSHFGIPIDQVHKTGLGSSAALVTSLVAATVLQCAPSSALSTGLRDGSPASRRKLHNLAQAAHSAAQGKVGSGFDVASAVYGSCKYRRFSPSVLSGVGKPGDADFQAQLVAVVDEPAAGPHWDHDINADVAVPPGLRLVMCDVDCGSGTPGMVRDVLKWRTEQPAAADELWTALQEQNDALADELVALCADSARPRAQLTAIIGRARALIRAMSTQARVPIEPAEQTQLIDACSSLPGVLGGVVPGAGGYDAIALLIEDSSDTAARLAALLGGYTFATTQASSGKVGLLGVKGESEGLRMEQAAGYASWT